MNFKKFVSENDRLRFLLASDWDEYDDESDDYAFFNAASKEWTGNLRITQFTWNVSELSKIEKGVEYVESELKNNPEAVKLKIGDFETARYFKRTTDEENNPLVIWYWILGCANQIFICSFTAPDIENSAIPYPKEFKTVEAMLSSIEVDKNEISH
jgi:hypothetical protein